MPKGREFQAISNPEFINLQPLEISPNISSVDIKVFYLGNNDNGSSIDKDAALKMATTLRGNPIVGWYSKEKGDFVDHGEQWVMDGEKGFQVNCLTIPYGFVAPDAKVWFQQFREEDRQGHVVDREYLMTNGYLWTGQFKEAAQAYKEGKAQSMELDSDSVDGDWDNNFEFFIINDATITKLCLLGDDVEPCFEGASVTASFSLDKQFDAKQIDKMHEMLNELKFALGGGKKNMPNDELEKNLDNDVQNESVAFNNTIETEKEVSEGTEVITEFDDGGDGESADSTDASADSTDASEEGTEDEVAEVDDDVADASEEEPAAEDEEDSEEDAEEEIDDTMNGQKKEFQLQIDELQKNLDEEKSKFSALQAQYDALEKECATLRQFKLESDRVVKRAKIDEFTALTDEDKNDVITNIDAYSLDEIISKMATLCYMKGVGFKKVEKSEEDSNAQPVYTFNVHTENYTPDWVKEVQATQESMNL